MIYFWSDPHFNHVNICGHSLSKWDKGFRKFSSLQEMENELVDKFNSKVQRADTVYLLGDVSMGQVAKELPRIRDRLLCDNIHLIYGNHDHKIRVTPELRRLFASCQDRLEVRFGGNLVVMDHYPMTVWNESGRGSIQLYGHTHFTMPEPLGRQFEVGVDGYDFYPVSLDFVLDKGLSKPIVVVDHHTDKTSYH